MNQEQTIENTAINLLRLAVTQLPKDIKEALQKAHQQETNPTGKTQLKAILDNIELAEKTQTPMCQDTGTIIFYIKAGSQTKNLDKIENALRNATKKATTQIPLRPNAVDPFKQKNTGDNTGKNIPFINWEIVPGNTLEITVLPKGGGSENVCTMGMLVPGEGIKGLRKFVIDTIIKAGAKPCPPNILGVAIGGGSDIAMKLAKKALLRPLNQPNPDPEIAKLEKELLEAANQTGIAPWDSAAKSQF